MSESIWDQVLAWGLAAIGWLTALAASLIGWIFRTAVFDRLGSIEQRIHRLELTSETTVKHVELDAHNNNIRNELVAVRETFRQELAATREGFTAEIRQLTNQLMEILRRERN